MPSKVPSRRSHPPTDTDEETSRPSTSPAPIRSKKTPSNSSKRSSGSKLVIVSKKSSASRVSSGNKRRKLTPESNDEVDEEMADDEAGNGEEDEVEQLREDVPDSAQPDGQNSPENDDEEQEEDDLDAVDPDKEILIPVAEDYDSEDSETGMADSLDKMTKEYPELPHQPGAIVRVQLDNFVTYTSVTFEPGPSLNMVIGPNGTGKSTLVCAICLGLGYGPQHLGRAKEIAEFVKNGCDVATIEIELKGQPQDETNPVVKRVIRRDGSSDYWIDGQKTSAKMVGRLTGMFNIQIDNLCQFLPQDRVVEFAGLGPIALLKETQRAAAPPEVLKDHEELKKLQKDDKAITVEMSGDQSTLETMENRQKILERDVVRLRERQSIQEYIELLESSIVFAEYKSTREGRVKLKEEYRARREELKALEEEQELNVQQMEESKEIRDTLRTWIGHKKKSLDSVEKKLKKEKEVGIEKLKEKEGDIASRMNVLKENERKRKANLEKTRSAIAKAEKLLDNDPGEIDLKSFNEKIEEKSKLLREIRIQKTDKENVVEPWRHEATQKANEIKWLRDKLKELNNAQGKKVQYLRTVSPDAGKVYDWLQQNQNKFTSQVFGPPMVECSIKDVNYQDEVEQCFSRYDKLAFTCTNDEDYKSFSDHVFGDKSTGREGLGVSDIAIRCIDRKFEDFKSIGNPEEVRSWGFEGLAIDFVEGPKEILSMLCSESNLHKVGITKNRLNAEQNEKASRNMRVWVSNKHMTQIKFRAEYGNASTELIFPIKPALLFKTAPIDLSVMERYKQDINKLESEMAEIQQRIELNKGNLQELQDRASEIDAEKKAIQAEKHQIQTKINEFQKAKTQLKNEEEKLLKLENDGKGYEDKVAALERDAMNINMERVEASVEYAQHVREFVSLYDELVKVELHAIEAASNVENLKDWSGGIQGRIDSKRAECEEVKRREHEQISLSNELRDKCRDILAKVNAEQREVLQQLEANKTINEIRDDIKHEYDRLEGIHEGNPNAIKQYEEREREIEALRAKMGAKEERLNKVRETIAKVRGRWEPRIDQLILNISDAFSRSFDFIGCAGSVRIRKDGNNGSDFENWAIEILVKFRETESMQVLTAQRQSGGERAVSTVFYLMALQSLARAPFRVVDEINQGMDPRNERLVHKRMVKIACKSHTSQYFLITPKLLVDLDYHERMTVLCINSGDWVVENHKQNYAVYLKAAKAMYPDI